MRALYLILLFGVATAAAYNPRHFEFGPPESLHDYDEAHGHGFEPDFPVRTAAGGVTADAGFFFSVDMPEGSWRVTVELVGAPGGSRTLKPSSDRIALIGP